MPDGPPPGAAAEAASPVRPRQLFAGGGYSKPLERELEDLIRKYTEIRERFHPNEESDPGVWLKEAKELLNATRNLPRFRGIRRQNPHMESAELEKSARLLSALHVWPAGSPKL